jgi:hypothetical protein
MVSWWPGDDCTPYDLIDGNPGTFVGFPVCALAKKVGNAALAFPANTYVVVPDAANLNFPGGTLTYDMWVKPDSCNGMLIDKFPTHAPFNGGYHLSIGNSGGICVLQGEAEDNMLRVLLNGPAVNLLDGQWHFIAMSLDVGNNFYQLYVDSFVTTGSLPLNTGATNVPGANLVFGGPCGFCTSEFEGLMDEIELFDRVLSPAELNTIYAAGACGKCKTGGPRRDKCFPGFDGVSACPCANPPLLACWGGCNNSANTGGAVLSSTGVSSVSADSLQFIASGEKPTATSILLQGTSRVVVGVAFGQGVRCVGGTLKRLYVHNAVGGVVTAPVAGDFSVSARSAALGFPILPPIYLQYMWYYRDPVLLGGCPSGSTFNSTQTQEVLWAP